MSESTYNTATIAPLTLDHTAPAAPASYEGEEMFVCHFSFEALMGGWSALRQVAEEADPWRDNPAHVAIELDRLADTYKALACMTTAIMQMEEKDVRTVSAHQAVVNARNETLRRAEGRGWDA